MVQAVFDFPVAAVEGEQFGRAGLLRSEGCETEDSLHGGFPGADDVPLAGDAEGLAASRQGGQFIRGTILGDAGHTLDKSPASQ